MPAPPGSPGSGSVSASDNGSVVTAGCTSDGADGAVFATGAGISGTGAGVASCCAGAASLVILIDCSEAWSESLGIELDRLIGICAFGLDGGGGDSGLLSEPLGDPLGDQPNADFSMSEKEGLRPVTGGEEVDGPSPVITTSGNVGPVDSACVESSAGCGAGDDCSIDPPSGPICCETGGVASN